MKKGIAIAVLLLLALTAVAGAIGSFGKKTVKLDDLNFSIEKVVKLKPEKKSCKTDLGNVSVLTNGGRIERTVTVSDKIRDGNLNVESKEFKVRAKVLGDVGTLGAFPISGTLKPGEAELYGPAFLNTGETFTVSLSWYPSDKPILLGFVDWNSGKVIAAWIISGGSVTASFTPSTAGNYGVLIGNAGTQTITYSGLVSW